MFVTYISCISRQIILSLSLTLFCLPKKLPYEVNLCTKDKHVYVEFCKYQRSVTVRYVVAVLPLCLKNMNLNWYDFWYMFCDEVIGITMVVVVLSLLFLILGIPRPDGSTE